VTIGLSAPLPAAQGIGGLPQKTDADYPTRLVDIAPGSRVRIGGAKVGGPAFDGTVLQTYESWGATGEPCLFLSPDFDKENPIAISQAAGYEVTVIANARDFISDELPASAVRVRVRPVHGVAIQFRGGVESATEIIQWALGRGAPRWNRGSDTEDETIVFGGIGLTEIVVRVGEWIILHDDETFHTVAQLAAVYEGEED
jgi:hypothetical protein